MPVLLPYQPNWPVDFQHVADVLRSGLHQSDISAIEHVGSTAIPGLAAKPILDIDIVLRASTDFPSVKNGLESLGYAHHGNQGIDDREVFKRSVGSENHPVLDFIAHHLYVCLPESVELQRHLLFRNYLRTHPEARNDYEKLKIDLAKQSGEDRKKYAALKESQVKWFFDEILRKAEKLTIS